LSSIYPPGHCVYGDTPQTLKVIAGEHDRRTLSGREQIRNVIQIIVHEAYDTPYQFANDIALLKFQEPMELNEFVGVICVPPQGPNNYTTRDVLRVSGWGSTFSGGNLSHTLRFVDVPGLSQEECQRAYAQETIDDGILCAGLPEGGKDSCQGDSGGPIVSLLEDEEGSDGSVVVGCVAGIVSWGYGCALPGYPGVYTRTSHFTEWIAKHME